MPKIIVFEAQIQKIIVVRRYEVEAESFNAAVEKVEAEGPEPIEEDEATEPEWAESGWGESEEEAQKNLISKEQES